MSTGTIEADSVVADGVTPAEWIRSHQAGVWRYLRFLGAQTAEADDLLQETFLVVLRRGFQQRTPAETSAYLRTAARRQLLMLRRKQGREQQLAIPLEQLPQAEVAWEQAAREDGLESYLDALGQCLPAAITDRARTALELQYRARASRSEIAQQLEMSVEGVKTLLRRAKDKLRQCVEKRVTR